MSRDIAGGPYISELDGRVLSPRLPVGADASLRKFADPRLVLPPITNPCFAEFGSRSAPVAENGSDRDSKCLGRRVMNAGGKAHMQYKWQGLNRIPYST